MKKLYLDNDIIETITIDDEEYVRLSDMPRIVGYAYGNHLNRAFREAIEDIRLVYTVDTIKIVNDKQADTMEKSWENSYDCR